MPRVVVSDHPSGRLDVEHELLDPLGAELVVAPSTDAETLAGLAREADALLVCYAPIPATVVAAAAEAGCRVISRYGIGFDNVDVEAATRAGIVVTNVPDYCLDEVADHTLALLLASTRGIVTAAEAVREGGWAWGVTLHSLQGRVLALIGIGRIGTKVAERAHAFGLRVVAYDPFVQASPPGVELVASLEEALAVADMVSLHLPLSAENRHVIRDETIAAMERSPVLINTSRGGLVDLDAVRRALDDGRLSSAALDVTDPEPLPADHPLRTHPKAIVTPHMGYYSEEAQAELQRRAAEEVVRALRGEPPRSPVNSDAIANAAS
jgi:D-3-phosphoglycerate dehydrogenase